MLRDVMENFKKRPCGCLSLVKDVILLILFLKREKFSQNV